MKPVTIHPVSLLAGAGLMAVALLATGADQRTSIAPKQIREVPTPSGTEPFIVGLPDPRDMLVIREGTPLTLQAGEIFVVTAIGTTESCGGAAELRVNGERQLYVSEQAETTVSLQAQFLTVPSPATIEVAAVFASSPWCGQGGNGRAWGYTLNEDDARSSHELMAEGGIASPRRSFTIEEGAAFTIPQGQIFVLTGLGNWPKGPFPPFPSFNDILFVDGVQELQAGDGAPWGSCKPTPPGFTVAAGHTIGVQGSGSSNPGRAWGFLVNANP